MMKAELTLFILIALTINILFTIYHENAHDQVYKLHGCHNTSITYSLIGGTTECHDLKKMDTQTQLQIAAYQSKAEIEGYHTIVAINAAYAIFLLWWATKK